MGSDGVEPGNIFYDAATWIIPLVVAIVLHEVSHGWAANAFGDPTAKRLGRLSPNPIRHVDPVGTIALPLVLAVAGAPVFGWAKPVPVVASRMRNPRIHMMLVALAGPAMNLALALLATLLLALIVPVAREGAVLLFLAANLIHFLVINIFLAIFNLLPIPPFDGGHVVEGLLPTRLARHYRKIGRYAFPMLVVLLVILPLLSPRANIVARLVSPPVDAIAGMLLALSGLAPR